MSVIFGFIGALLQQFASLFYRKGIDKAGTDLHKGTYVFFGCFWMSIFICVLVLILSLMGKFSFEIWGKGALLLFGLYIVTTLLRYFKQLLSIYINSNEKMSVLTPFTSFQKIFGIVLGFLIFQDATIKAFIFALIAILVITISRFDLGKLHVSKYCGLTIVTSFMGAVKTLITTYILLSLSTVEYLFWSQLVILTFSTVAFFIMNKSLGMLFSPSAKTERKYRLYDKGFFFFSALISLFLLKEFGVVITLLISMVALVIRFLMISYFLNDKPTRKDVIVSLVVLTCIFFGVQ